MQRGLFFLGVFLFFEARAFAGADPPPDALPGNAITNTHKSVEESSQGKKRREADLDPKKMEALVEVLGSQETYDQLQAGIAALSTEGTPREQMDANTAYLDEFIKKQKLSEEQSKEFYQHYFDAMSEAQRNSPMGYLIHARTMDAKSLEANGAFEPGSQRDDMPNIVLARMAFRRELERRVAVWFSLSEKESRQLAGLLRLPARANADESPDTRLAQYLVNNFDAETLRAMQAKIDRSGSSDEAKRYRNIFSRGIQTALTLQPATRPDLPRGTFQAESFDGQFLTARGNLRVPVIRTILEEPGTRVFVLGTTEDEIDKEIPDLPPSARSRLIAFEGSAPWGRWTTDYRGLPVQTPGGEPLVLSPKYFKGTASTAAFDRVALPGERQPFPYYLEGGNISAVTTANGEKVVMVSDAYIRENAKKMHASPQESLAAFRRSFGEGARVVVLPGQNDGTGHVDMFVKPSPDGTVFVGDYRERDMVAQGGSLESFARQGDSLMDESARRLGEVPGLRVVRVPQIPSSRDTYTKLNSLFFTNGNGERIAILPNYPLKRLNEEINRENISILRRAGFDDIKLVDTDLNRRQGVFHCILPQIGLNSSYCRAQ